MSNSNKHWELNPELKELADEGGGPAVAQILRGFLDDAEDQMRRAEDAVRAEDCETLRFAAHTLSGSAATVGLNEFSEVARQLQLLAYAQKISESHEQLEDLRKKLTPAKRALNETISELEPRPPQSNS
jgi:HPt (histidine-containing phosphotransfer) domain-containing protein